VSAADHSHLGGEENDLIAEEMGRLCSTSIKSEFCEKDAILHLRMFECRPAIWRRVRVPANITLDVLHDKVLVPLMGWIRNYHSYLFMLPNRKDKRVGFGRMFSRTVDAVNQRFLWGGEAMCDAAQVALCDVSSYLRMPSEFFFFFFLQWSVRLFVFVPSVLNFFSR
jgi:hypothetical protein